jgi:hypothetical protein
MMNATSKVMQTAFCISGARLRISIVFIALALTACGGGGGGSPPPAGPVTSTLSFPLLAGVTALDASGFNATLTANGTGAVPANGDCSGTVNLAAGPANVATMFEGAPALSATEVITFSFTNCLPANISETTTDYYSSTYMSLGYSVLGDGYGVWTAPPAIPASVMVGDTGIAGTIAAYTDSTKAVDDGRTDTSWIVEPDTATTAIVNVISKSYDSASNLESTEQDKYRITSTGVLTLISIDFQRVNPPLHLVFR